MDLVPSILSLANIKTDTAFDGQRLDSIILGNTDDSRNAPLFFVDHRIEIPFTGYLTALT